MKRSFRRRISICLSPLFHSRFPYRCLWKSHSPKARRPTRWHSRTKRRFGKYLSAHGLTASNSGKRKIQRRLSRSRCGRTAAFRSRRLSGKIRAASTPIWANGRWNGCMPNMKIRPTFSVWNWMKQTIHFWTVAVAWRFSSGAAHTVRRLDCAGAVTDQQRGQPVLVLVRGHMACLAADGRTPAAAGKPAQKR